MGGMPVDAYVTLGVDREFNLTEELLLKAMDAVEVDQALVAPVDRCLAVANQEGNRAMVKAARAHRRRLIACCTANPWFGTKAVEEVARAAGEGARMLVLHPAVQGFLANDELGFPLIEAAGRERIPVYVHTGPPGHASPWMLADLAERFPQVDFVMGHMGATDFWTDAAQAAAAAPNLYLEASLGRPFNFARALSVVGAKKGLAGSAAPLNDLALEWRQLKKHVPAPMWEDAAGNNILRLLGKRGGL